MGSNTTKRGDVGVCVRECELMRKLLSDFLFLPTVVGPGIYSFIKKVFKSLKFLRKIKIMSITCPRNNKIEQCGNSRAQGRQ